MRGLTLFAEKVTREPLSAAVGIIVDYATFFGMCGLAFVLFLLRWPLRAVDGLFHTRTRECLTNLIARVSHG